MPEEGINIKLKVKGTESVSFRIMDGTYELPMDGLPDRPNTFMGRYEYDGMSLVVKNFLID